MKKTIQTLFLIAALTTILASCDKVEEATTISIDSSEKIAFTIALNPGQSIDESMTYDLSDNTEIKDYLDKLKGVEVTKVYYVITSFSSSTQTTGSISFTLNSEAFGPFEHNFIEDVNNTKETTLDSDKLNTVSSALFTSKKLSISIKGSHSIPSTETNSEQLGIDLYLNLKFSASPL